MAIEHNAVELPLPERADEPIASMQYYNIIPVLQADAANPVCLALEKDEFEEGVKVVFAPLSDAGHAHFRVEGGRKDTYRLQSRNSGKVLYADIGTLIQFTHPQQDYSGAELDLIPCGKHRYRIATRANPKAQLRAEGRDVPVAGSGLEVKPSDRAGLEFYLVPATRFVWLDTSDSYIRPHQDATEMILRKLADGVIGFASDKLKEMADIPGGSIILGGALSLLWPEKSLDETLQEFRKDLLQDMRNLQASDTLVKATNELIDVRKKYAMQYRDIKRADIDRADARSSTKETALRYADDFSKAILALLPGVTKDDGTINEPIPPELHSLVRAGLGTYVQGALDHLSALQERALLDSFDPANVIRFYAKTDDGRYFSAGTDDCLKLSQGARDRGRTPSLVNIVDGTVSHGDLIAFKVCNGNYMSAFFGNYGVPTAIRKKRTEWEIFRIERLAGAGRVEAGDRIALACSEGGYLSLDNAKTGEIGIGSISVGDNETFIFHRKDGRGAVRHGNRVGLQAANGQFLCALEGGGYGLRADRPQFADWETLTIERVTVGNILHYGNQVVIRRPTDGRFASVFFGADGLNPLKIENSKISKYSVFTVEGGPVGNTVGNGDKFQLRAVDNRYVTTNNSGALLAGTTSTTFQAEIINGEPQALRTTGEPSDWIKSYVNTYAKNIYTMLTFLILKRFEKLHKERNEIAKVKGYVVIFEDRLIKRTLFRGMESSPKDFKFNDDWIEVIKNLYMNHTARNDVMIKHRPLMTFYRLGDVGKATDAMCLRLRRNLDVSTEFWRQAVIPDRTEWTL